jgi:ferredoxin
MKGKDTKPETAEQEKEREVRAIVDEQTCTGCGLCEESCPEVFRLDNDVAHVIVDEVPPDRVAAAREAAQRCPVEGITIE